MSNLPPVLSRALGQPAGTADACPSRHSGREIGIQQASRETKSLLTVAQPQKTTQPGFVGRGLCTQETGWYWVPHRDAAFELLQDPGTGHLLAASSRSDQDLWALVATPHLPSWPLLATQAPVQCAWPALGCLLKAGPPCLPLPGPSRSQAVYLNPCVRFLGLRWAARS